MFHHHAVGADVKQDGDEFTLLSSSRTWEPIVEQPGAEARMYRHGTLSVPEGGSNGLRVGLSRCQNAAVSSGTEE